MSRKKVIGGISAFIAAHSLVITSITPDDPPIVLPYDGGLPSAMATFDMDGVDGQLQIVVWPTENEPHESLIQDFADMFRMLSWADESDENRAALRECIEVSQDVAGRDEIVEDIERRSYEARDIFRVWMGDERFAAFVACGRNPLEG